MNSPRHAVIYKPGYYNILSGLPLTIIDCLKYTSSPLAVLLYSLFIVSLIRANVT
jgi:hypothetical protein